MNPFPQRDLKQYLNPWVPLLISLLYLISAGGQYHFRRFDNNVVSNWNLIFTVDSPLLFFSALIPGLILASWAFKITIPPRARSFVLFLSCFIAAAFSWSVPEVNISTSRYIMQAKHLELYGVRYFLHEWGRDIAAWTDLPLVPFLHGLLFKLFEESRIIVQIFNALLFSMTAVLTSLIGKELWDEETGWYAGAFLLGMPYFIIMTPLMLVDIQTIFSLMLSIFLFLRAVTAGGAWRLSSAVIAIFLTACTKYSALPLLTILPLITAVFYLTAEKEHRQRVLRRSAAIFLGSLILVGSAAALALDIITAQIELIRSIQVPNVNRRIETYVSTSLFQINPAITVAALASFLLALVKRDIKYAIAAWLPFLIVLFQIKNSRYSLPAFPLFALMASYGLSSIQTLAYRKVIAAGAVVMSLATCFFIYVPYLSRSSDANLIEAGKFLNTLDIDTVEVYTVPKENYPINPAVAVPILDLFTHKKMTYRYVPGSSFPGKKYSIYFSWDYRNPKFYEPDVHETAGKKAIAVILNNPHDKVPPDVADIASRYRNSTFFAKSYPLYLYQTLVRVYW